MTVLERLIQSLRTAAHYNRSDQSPPSVVLWSDGDRLWTKVIPALQEALPQLLVLHPAEISVIGGPSTYLRYRITQAGEPVPILYLPGVSRQAFRSASGFPSIARHLFALQFQGQFWSQTNGKDWTPLAFLTNTDEGLGLDVSRDSATLEALASQLHHLLNTAVEQVQGQRISAELLHGLVADDPVRMVLQWMASDGRLQDTWSRTSQWEGFSALAKKQLKLDPAKDGVITAAERLVHGAKEWEPVWQRYKESPHAFPGLRAILNRVQPDGLFSADNERLPVGNQHQEEVLRDALLAIPELSAKAAREQLAQLVREHEDRSRWVWAALGESPLAGATVHLGNMLRAMGTGLDTGSWDSLAEDYLTHGWRVDSCAREAYAAASKASNPASASKAVVAALRSVYLPWLEDLATRCQQIGDQYPKRVPADAFRFTTTPGSVLLFVDGLRADIGVELADQLREQGISVERSIAWSALPTVTATAKPAWAPMTEHVHGEAIGTGFEPKLKAGGLLRTQEFRAQLKKLGWDYLSPSDTGDPATSAWTESGAFDRYGHDQGAKLAWRIQEELTTIRQRVLELLNAGWSVVHVVTDHGWLWMPGGLPKAYLPTHLTEAKWGRCALPQNGAKHGLPSVCWFWGTEHSIVLAPNICVFIAGLEYAHGGLSLQEALTPVLEFSRVGGSEATVSIDSIKWVGMRLQVSLSGGYEGAILDIRRLAADPDSSVLHTPKAADSSGKASLAVDDSKNGGEVGASAALVVSKGNTVLAKKSITIAQS
jgi:hypothetical protein